MAVAISGAAHRPYGVVQRLRWCRWAKACPANKVAQPFRPDARLARLSRAFSDIAPW